MQAPARRAAVSLGIPNACDFFPSQSIMFAAPQIYPSPFNPPIGAFGPVLPTIAAKKQPTVIPTEVTASYFFVPFPGTRRHAAEGPLMLPCLFRGGLTHSGMRPVRTGRSLLLQQGRF
jgi:hypothetical protein